MFRINTVAAVIGLSVVVARLIAPDRGAEPVAERECATQVVAPGAVQEGADLGPAAPNLARHLEAVAALLEPQDPAAAREFRGLARAYGGAGQ